jgi:hypothetical protein
MEDKGHLGHYEKTKPINHGHKGEEVQDKCIENIFKKIIRENFPNLETKTAIQVHDAFKTPKTRKEPLQDIS